MRIGSLDGPRLGIQIPIPAAHCIHRTQVLSMIERHGFVFNSARVLLGLECHDSGLWWHGSCSLRIQNCADHGQTVVETEPSTSDRESSIVGKLQSLGKVCD
jgi:hypothetical protein